MWLKKPAEKCDSFSHRPYSILCTQRLDDCSYSTTATYITANSRQYINFSCNRVTYQRCKPETNRQTPYSAIDSHSPAAVSPIRAIRIGSSRIAPISRGRIVPPRQPRIFIAIEAGQRSALRGTLSIWRTQSVAEEEQRNDLPEQPAGKGSFSIASGWNKPVACVFAAYDERGPEGQSPPRLLLLLLYLSPFPSA